MLVKLPFVTFVSSTIATALVAGGAPAAARAQAPGDSLARTDTVAPGIVHRTWRRTEGPLEFHVLRIELAAGPWTVVARHAGDAIRGREPVSAMATRLAATREVVAALNADFFHIDTAAAERAKLGEVENNFVVDGTPWRAVPAPSGWHTPALRQRGQFALAADGPRIGRFVYRGRVRAGRSEFRLDGLNGIPKPADALVTFDGRWGSTPVADRRQPAPREATVRGVRLVGYGGAGGARLDSIVRASRRRWWPDRRPRVTHAFALDSAADAPPLVPWTLVGGWPLLLRAGRDVTDEAIPIEGHFPAFMNARAPRSVVGTSEGGRVLWFATVGGANPRQRRGTTPAEFAAFLRGLGVEEALNLDGGGSTTLWLRGQVVNQPSDATGERPVGNALFVVRGRPWEAPPGAAPPAPPPPTR